MDAVIETYLSTVKFGEWQVFNNMAILPLFATSSPLAYVTLKEALENQLVTITEVSEGGSVPDLKIKNRSDQLILLFDGEELVGAKQNRVLNTTILLAGYAETVIPVSCTEQGRWRYTAAQFSHSNLMLSSSVRRAKSRSVHRTLRASGGYRSDQGQVWNRIEAMHQTVQEPSPTRAMRDVYSALTDELAAYEKAFTWLPHQQGCLVFINGRLRGMDILSNEAAYQAIHPQLVKSYALEAHLARQETAEEPSEETAGAFLQTARQSKEEQFEAVGLGRDYRYESDQVSGSALVHEQQVVHLTFFKDDEPGQPGQSMQRSRDLRGSRSSHYRRIRIPRDFE